MTIEETIEGLISTSLASGNYGKFINDLKMIKATPEEVAKMDLYGDVKFGQLVSKVLSDVNNGVNYNNDIKELYNYTKASQKAFSDETEDFSMKEAPTLNEPTPLNLNNLAAEVANLQGSVNAIADTLNSKIRSGVTKNIDDVSNAELEAKVVNHSDIQNLVKRITQVSNKLAFSDLSDEKRESLTDTLNKLNARLAAFSDVEDIEVTSEEVPDEVVEGEEVTDENMCDTNYSDTENFGWTNAAAKGMGNLARGMKSFEKVGNSLANTYKRNSRSIMSTAGALTSMARGESAVKGAAGGYVAGSIAAHGAKRDAKKAAKLDKIENANAVANAKAKTKIANEKAKQNKINAPKPKKLPNDKYEVAINDNTTKKQIADANKPATSISAKDRGVSAPTTQKPAKQVSAPATSTPAKASKPTTTSNSNKRSLFTRKPKYDYQDTINQYKAAQDQEAARRQEMFRAAHYGDDQYMSEKYNFCDAVGTPVEEVQFGKTYWVPGSDNEPAMKVLATETGFSLVDPEGVFAEDGTQIEVNCSELYDLPVVFSEDGNTYCSTDFSWTDDYDYQYFSDCGCYDDYEDFSENEEYSEMTDEDTGKDDLTEAVNDSIATEDVADAVEKDMEAGIEQGTKNYSEALLYYSENYGADFARAYDEYFSEVVDEAENMYAEFSELVEKDMNAGVEFGTDSYSDALKYYSENYGDDTAELYHQIFSETYFSDENPAGPTTEESTEALEEVEPETIAEVIKSDKEAGVEFGTTEYSEALKYYSETYGDEFAEVYHLAFSELENFGDVNIKVDKDSAEDKSAEQAPAPEAPADAPAQEQAPAPASESSENNPSDHSKSWYDGYNTAKTDPDTNEANKTARAAELAAKFGYKADTPEFKDFVDGFDAGTNKAASQTQEGNKNVATVTASEKEMFTNSANFSESGSTESRFERLQATLFTE